MMQKHMIIYNLCNISYSFSEDVACSNETLELYYKPLNMPILRVFCWASLFILGIRFPPGTSVARTLNMSLPFLLLRL